MLTRKGVIILLVLLAIVSFTVPAFGWGQAKGLTGENGRIDFGQRGLIGENGRYHGNGFGGRSARMGPEVTPVPRPKPRPKVEPLPLPKARTYGTPVPFPISEPRPDVTHINIR